MMFSKITPYHPFLLLLILSLILAACTAQPASPEPVVETLVVTEVVEATPVETVQLIQVVTPTPEPSGPRTLVICMGFEPNSIYPYGSESLAVSEILEAIADGGWSAFDNNSFANQPVLLEKLPNLADGDASISVVTVREGDRVVDADGTVVSLDPAADPPIMLVPAGGGDSIPYQGGEIEMEQLSARFTLLPELLWSDGQPLTAEDSAYAFQLLQDPDTLHPSSEKGKIEHTASYEALDERTTVWTGLPGFMGAGYFTNFFGPAPEHLWGRYSASELLTAEESSRKPVGWGPYVIDEWVAGESISLHKNPNYFRAAEGLPKFDRLIFRFVSDDMSTNLAALLAGECDNVDPIGLQSNLDQRLLDLQDSGQIKATFTTGTVWTHVDFSIQHVDYDDGYQIGVDRPDYFSDVRTRQAFATCMDRQTMVETIYFGHSIVIDSYLPPQHPLYNPEVRHYDFDVQAGSALLEEIGWVDEDGDPGSPRIARGVAGVPDGTPLVLTFYSPTSEVFEQVSSILQESFAQCGIQVSIRITPDWFADGPEGPIFGRQFDLVGFPWWTGAEPPCELYLSTSTPGPVGEEWVSVQDGAQRRFGIGGWGAPNDPGFADQQYDAACLGARNSLPGQPEYAAGHLEAQRIFAEQLPVVPLNLEIKLAVSRPDMCGFIMDPSNNTGTWNIEEFDYGEGCEE